MPNQSSSPALILFAVSYVEWGDDNLTTKLFYAEDEVAACKAWFKYIGMVAPDEITTLDAMKDFVFNRDCMIHAVSLPFLLSSTLTPPATNRRIDAAAAVGDDGRVEK